MAFDKIKEHAQSIPKQIEDVCDSNIEYYKLSLFRFIAKSANIFLKAFALGALLLLLLFFLFFAVAFALGDMLNSIALGFISVSAVFGILTIVVYVFRKTLIERPLLLKLSEFYFNQELDKSDTK